VTHTIKTIVMASVFCALVAALPGQTASAQDGNYKIGVVDMQAVLAGYEKRKTKYEELQKNVDNLQKGIDAMSKDIQKRKDDYDAKKQSMTPEQLLELETEINADYADYQNELKKSQQKIDSMEAQVLREVVKDIQEAIEAVAKKGNYHLVLNKESGPRSAVLFAQTSIEITSQILDHLNK